MNGLQQVRFAQTAGAVNEQRAVLCARVLDHADGASVGEAIAGAHDEIFQPTAQWFLHFGRTAAALLTRFTLRIVGHKMNLRIELALLQVLAQ